MQILSKFCHNNHLTREMAPLKTNTTDASQCTNALLFNSATFIKTGSYSQKSYYKIISKANKY